MEANLNLKIQLMDVVILVWVTWFEKYTWESLKDSRSLDQITTITCLVSICNGCSGRMWFNLLSNFLLMRGYTNRDDCPCVFINKSNDVFCIIAVYVNDLNIIRTTMDIEKVSAYLKSESEMKNLGKTKFCFGPAAQTPPWRSVYKPVHLYK